MQTGFRFFLTQKKAHFHYMKWENKTIVTEVLMELPQDI